MAGPTSITPTDGTWILHEPVTSPYPAAPITPTDGTWITHLPVGTPYGPNPITPTNGTWIIHADIDPEPTPPVGPFCPPMPSCCGNFPRYILPG